MKKFICIFKLFVLTITFRIDSTCLYSNNNQHSSNILSTTTQQVFPSLNIACSSAQQLNNFLETFTQQFNSFYYLTFPSENDSFCTINFFDFTTNTYETLTLNEIRDLMNIVENISFNFVINGTQITAIQN